MLDNETSAPNHNAGRHAQPSARPRPRPSAIVRTIWIVAPASATVRTGVELAKRELEAEREQQQHHAELGQLLDVVHVADRRPAGERTDDDAGQDVADDQRLPEALRQKAAREGGQRARA